MDHAKLLKFAANEKQREAIMAVVEHGSQRAAAAALGCAQSTLNSHIAKAKAAAGGGSTDQRQRVAELEKLVERQAAQLERMRTSQVNIPAGAKQVSSKGGYCRMAIPDTHGCAADAMALSAMLGDMEVVKPNEIVMLGDHLDCGGFLAQHHTLGYVAQTSYTFEDDANATNQLLDQIQSLCQGAAIHYIEGNHECLTPDHEVLTKSGWKPIADVSCGDLVATMGPRRNVEWHSPSSTSSMHFSGKLVTTGDNRYVRFQATPNHRFMVYKQGGNDLRWIRGEDFINGAPRATYRIPTTASNELPEYPLSDDEIRLAAWILTDGGITGKVAIHQSKEENFDKIRSILEACHVRWAESTRHRDPPVICGVQVKEAKPEVSFNLDSESSRRVARQLFGIEGYTYKTRCKKSVPAWVHELSQRQVGVLLESMVDANGVRVGKAYALYGLPEVLNEVQALLCVNGYRVSLSSKYSKKQKKHHLCLNITHRDRVKLEACKFHEMDYDGPVHCITVANENFFVRHKGRVHVTGNSRLEKWCVTQALRNAIDAEYLRKMFCTDAVLSLEKRGIRWIRQGVFYDDLTLPGTIKLGHCYFTHGSMTNAHAASAHVKKFGGNVVFGHVHRADSYIIRTVKEGAIGGWCPGCLCKLQPLWMHTQPTDWSHGYGLQLVNEDGSFLHINVPIIGGRSYLGPLVEALR